MRSAIGPMTIFVGLAMLTAGPLGCSSRSALSLTAVGGTGGGSMGSDASATGGSDAQPGAGGAGGAATPSDTGGSAAIAGTTATSGGAPGIGGSSAVAGASGTGGTVAAGGTSTKDGGSAGTMANTGGATYMGGATKIGGSPGSGGSSGLAGAPASGGASGIDGGAGTCTGCQPHESCWSGSSGSRCIESSVTVPGFAIDATEVTRGQYAAWLATNPPTTGQPAVCDWNTTFVPDATCMAKASVCQGSSCTNHPQPCIDHCDAAAYCRAIDRSLCGDEDWTNACSSNGTYPLGYEATSVRGTCNDYTTASTTTVPVASKTGCHPPASSVFTGVFDMIGNIAEWVDNCTGTSGATDVCKPRGLSFGMGAAAPTCSQSTYSSRSASLDNLGFRCCTH